MPIKISKYDLPNFSEIKLPTCPIKAADTIINKPKIKVTFDTLLLSKAQGPKSDVKKRKNLKMRKKVLGDTKMN